MDHKQKILNRKQKIIIFSGLGIVLVLIALVVYMLISQNNPDGSKDETTENVSDEQSRIDSLQLAYDQLELTNEYQQLEANFSQYEEQQKYLKNDTLVRQYNEAKARVESLLKQLKQEKRSNNENREKIKQLQAEIATLKDIVKHYLEEIRRLGEENATLKQEIEQVSVRNQELSSQVASATASNEQLTATVQRAKKLNVTGVSLQAYNKKDKPEKKISKARKLGVSFTVAPNNTASPGLKTFYVRVLTPEGSLLGGGSSFSFNGQSLLASAATQKEYSNDELKVTIYVDVTATPTPGSYTVDIFCDGYRLASRHFEMKK